MPIEIQIEKMYGKGLEKTDLMAKARAYAKEQVAKQKAGFKRLGVLADWENPYLTMRPGTVSYTHLSCEQNKRLYISNYGQKMTLHA